MSADTQRIYGPAGLDIGADSPEEIALAILAEIGAVIAGRTGQSLRDRHCPIHDRRAKSRLARLRKCVCEKHLAVGRRICIEFGWTGGVASAARKTSDLLHTGHSRDPASHGTCKSSGSNVRRCSWVKSKQVTLFPRTIRL